MPAWIDNVLQWFKDWVEYALLHAWKLLCDGFASVIEAIPVPSFFATASSQLGGIPGTVVFWLSFIQADFGIPLVISAYVLRWVLRRIPFIG